MINFGKKGRDKITGFTGIITAKCEYMYGCAQYVLTPAIDKKGKKEDGEWFDEGRVEILEMVVKPEKVKVEKGGCENREHPSNR